MRARCCCLWVLNFKCFWIRQMQREQQKRLPTDAQAHLHTHTHSKSAQWQHSDTQTLGGPRNSELHSLCLYQCDSIACSTPPPLSPSLFVAWPDLFAFFVRQKWLKILD